MLERQRRQTKMEAPELRAVTRKMRQMRGAGSVKVSLVVGDTNPADLFTEILSKQLFEKHRRFVLNLAVRP